MTSAPAAGRDAGVAAATKPSAALEASLQAEPSQLEFGGVGELSSKTMTVTLTWSGDGDLLVDGFGFESLTLDPVLDFAVTAETCTVAPLPTGGSCSVDVTYVPTAQVRRQGYLSILGPGGEVLAWAVFLDGWGDPYQPSFEFGQPTTAQSPYVWSHGSALARTARAGGEYLHLVSMTDHVSGRWVRDSGPHLAVRYQRSTDGETWSARKRVNPSSEHGYWAATAASGSKVLVTWVQSAELDMPSNAPRVLYLRRNTESGARSGWRSIQRLSSLRGRVDMPAVAVSGKRVLVAWTNGATGAIRVARSTDGGKTFKTSTVGKTTHVTTLGRSGRPKVAISGKTAIVAWISDGNGGPVKARISTDGASSWGPTTLVTNRSHSVHSVAAGPGRAIVAVSDGEIITREWRGAWDSTIELPVPTLFQVETDPVIVLRGQSTIAMAWTGCSSQWRGDCDSLSDDTRLDVVWAESPDDGLHWSAPIPVAWASSLDPVLVNQTPSIVWGSRRVVAWNVSSVVRSNLTFTGQSSYRVDVRVGVPAAAP